MQMALKADVINACRSEGSQKPVDLVYLSSMTMGDRNLESEILGMFAAQLPNYLQTIKDSTSSDDLYRAAHTLKGAARSVGAFQLAQIATDIEDEAVLDLQVLESEVHNICEYISEITS